MFFPYFVRRIRGGNYVFILLFVISALSLTGCPIYVDKTVQVPLAQQDGFSWETAFSTIQAGVDDAVNSSRGTWAIWVRGESDAVPGGNPYCDGIYNESIVADPPRDVYIFGGFNGTEEPYYEEEGGAELLAKERSWIMNPTCIDGTNISGTSWLVTLSGSVHIDGFTLRNAALMCGALGFTTGNVESVASNIVFEDNQAWMFGGGVTVGDGDVKIANCLFRNNEADMGGAVYVAQSSAVDMINCTITGNNADNGIISVESATAAMNVTNTILWDNTFSQQLIDGSPSITYSCVQGGYTGTGNISQDPVFVDAIPALSYGSPCIDTGIIADAPDHDIMKNFRPIGDGVDMGAYEGIYTADMEGAIAINELLIENETINQDEDGDFSPWLELHNTSLTNINLQGWTLTHGASQWTFPSITLASGEYKLVFLSGKNRTGNELHTNFTPSTQGGTLLLRDTQNPPASFMYFDYPADPEPDVSYGFNESTNVDPNAKTLIPVVPCRPPTPEDRNDTYFGCVLGVCQLYDPAYLDRLEVLTGIWGWRKGYKLDKVYNVDSQYIIDNINKYDVFYINSHGGAVSNLQYGWICLSDRSMRNTELATYIDSDHRFKFVHMNVCLNGIVGDEWLEAFNAITFLGWDEGVSTQHGEAFDKYFYRDRIYGQGQTIYNAAKNADLDVHREDADIIHWYAPGPVPETVVSGNGDQRLDVPSSRIRIES